MKYLYPTVLLTLGMFMGLGTLFTTNGQAFAQEHKTRISLTDTLLDIVDTYEAIGVGAGVKGIEDAALDATVSVLSVPESDLVPLTAAILDWSKAAQDLALMLQTGGTELYPVAVKSAGLPNAPYSFCGSERVSTEIVIATHAAYLVAELAREALLRACQQVVVILGEGGSVSAGCIATDVTFYLIKEVYDAFAICQADVDSAEIKGSYERAGHIHSDIEALGEKLDLIIDLVLANAAAIEANRLAICDNKRLLVSPQGSRESNCETCFDQPGYPYSWPEGRGKESG